MDLIKIENLSFSYGGNVDIIKNINITLKQGDFTTIVGENGSGKSTLIKCIVGLNKNYKGIIEINEKIGYLSQVTEVQNNFPATIEEVVLSGTISNGLKRIFYNSKDKKIANEVMKDLELYDIRKKCFRELSGGQKQRVLIARAMCSNGKLLILDEPVTGLDPSIAIQIYKTLYSLNKKHNMTIVMVSHDVDRALSYCDRVIEMKNGEIVFNDLQAKYKDGGNK